MNLLDELEYRELLYQVTDREGLAKRLAAGPITLYIGFDPTADSLHIGNLLQILLLRRFQLQGHHPIAVAGGGTGLVGDPSGKSNERKLNSEKVVEGYTRKMRPQLEQYLDFDSRENPARIVNNYEWLANLSLLPFLRDIGKHFPIGVMLAKDSVKSRLEEGISYTEFSYMIMQAYDYLQLNVEYQCELQAGGSDQWGNITAGVDLIRRMKRETVYGLTQPLVTQTDGTKLGKTEKGTIWLDADMTSPYEFYQYWMNVDDRDVIRFLKYFTFLTKNQVTELEQRFNEEPWKREAQQTLAREITRLVHGPEAMNSAEQISQALFYGKIADLDSDQLLQALNDVPTYDLMSVETIGLVELLTDAEIVTSKRRAREDINNGAITVNDIRVKDENKILGLVDRIAGNYLVIRRGKTNYFLVRWQI
ncbi:MAG TPA: tyrosine--tRNA ligase [Patescibacteria group bacterium]|nr:tyrosine--tRNA ligase [Patescibacteria group bacterium]